MRGCCELCLLLLLCCGRVLAVPQDFAGARDLPTVAEASDYQATSTSEEVLIFLRACDERAGHVRMFEFGRTEQDREMSGLVIADPPVGDWEQLRSGGDGRLVVMLLGNIHSGECDGKEALLMLARELALTSDHPWLKQAVFVLVPNYNADGNDQVSVENRPGQVGPVRGMGRRETSRGFDLNRDFVKLETAEGRALVRLIDRWNPHVFIDCHTTNGSVHRYPLTYDIPHNPAVAAPLREFLRGEFMPEVTERMRKAGFETFYYGNFARQQTRWESFGFEPRYSTEYLGLRGRIGILSESYSYADYRTRVFASREFVRQCVEVSLSRAGQISRVLGELERGAELGQGRGGDLPLNAVLGPFEQKVTVLGRVPGSDEPRDYAVEYWGRYEATKRVSLPVACVLPEASESVLQNLRNHGVRLSVLQQAVKVPVVVRRIASISRSAMAFQQHHLVQLETEEVRVERELGAGTVIVLTAQPLGRLAAWLLEAESCDGLTTWNFFDGVLREGGEYPVLMVPDVVDWKLAPLPRVGGGQ
ncbi:MAG: M14 family metallopeptidase [Planctomycetaceae bacterium]